MEFLSNKCFDINVSKYSITQIDKAKHTDEMGDSYATHVRIDYKNSGVGSASCGPDLEPQFRLSEKKIQFAFSIILLLLQMYHKLQHLQLGMNQFPYKLQLNLLDHFHLKYL